ncbi:hypothetical protein EV361DRAFT_7519 [Lentinula raphanica]|uniref:Uncharacterized protein n=1 Tax=Lentinula raphanica TaxID=153919 RepID=A0AA38P012_9AGAR|nr:hypothetical protein F5878DRAFT_388274 [Lentinula raphanica]KAJ3977449.1 hypothetical protein EV361DRAFT_7519 [Lentinula raphanica]
MRADIVAFVTLELLGAFFFFLVVITAAFSSRVKRYATWYSFCASWVISGLSYSLLLVVNAYATLSTSNRSMDVNQVELVPEWKAHRVCMTQAALIYASDVLTGFTSLSMCCHVLLYVRAALKVPMGQVKTSTTISLVIVPYIIWVTMFSIMFQLGNAQPDAVQVVPSGFYCHLALPEPVAVCSSIAVIASLSVAIAEIWMAVVIHRYRDVLPRIAHPITFILRVLLFGFVDLFALIVGSLMLVPGTKNVGTHFILSLLPVLGILIFGTQNDILQVWMFWKKTSSEDMTTTATPRNSDVAERLLKARNRISASSAFDLSV